MQNKHLCAALLAAGESSRFGGPSKLLIDWRGIPLIVHMASLLEAIMAVERVVVIVNPHQHGVDQALAGLSIEIIHNEEFADGLSSSVKTSVMNAANCDGLLLCPADMPHLSLPSLNLLAETWANAPLNSIVAAYSNGEHRSPAIFSKEWFPELLAIEGDKGAREILASSPPELISCSFESYELEDIDRPSDVW